MSARVYTFSNLRIGSAAAMAVDPTAIRVRADDRDAFTRVIEAREALIAARLDRFMTASPAVSLVDGAVECARESFTAIEAGDRSELLRSRLALTAALAITALREIEEN